MSVKRFMRGAVLTALFAGLFAAGMSTLPAESEAGKWKFKASVNKNYNGWNNNHWNNNHWNNNWNRTTYPYNRYDRYDRRDAGAAAAAGIAGFAAGAILGSALSQPQAPAYAPAPVYAAPPPPAYPDRHAYCASKYRSYDRATGTYMGYDGIRHYCQ